MPTLSSPPPPDWERFYLNNRRTLLACATAWCGNADKALDLIQEALTRQMTRETQPANLLAYVLRSIRNLAIDRFRDSRSDQEVSIDADALVSSDSAPAEQREECDRLLTALEHLPQQQREAIVLRTIAGLTIAEAAAILEKPAGSIASAYARGIELLQKIMESEHPHENRRSGAQARDAAALPTRPRS